MKTQRQLYALEARLTHKYVDSCSHLDDWDYIGCYSLLSSACTEDGNGYDEGGSYSHLLRVDVPHGVTAHDIEGALHNAISHHGCSHEYDCCGCASRTVTKIRHVRGKEWRVDFSIGYNY